MLVKTQALPSNSASLLKYSRESLLYLSTIPNLNVQGRDEWSWQMEYLGTPFPPEFRAWYGTTALLGWRSMPEAVSIATYIPPNQVRSVLPKVIPWLEKTISEEGYKGWTIESLVDDLVCGRKQLWAGQRGEHFLFVVTEVYQEVLGPSLHLVLGGGSLDPEKAMLEHITLLENWARFNKFKSVVVWGRLAWGRLLKPQGYKFDTAAFRHTFPERLN
jgi:hypothetical protein